MPAIAIPVAYWAVGGLLALAGTVAWQRSGGPEKTAQAIDNAIASMWGADEQAEAQAGAEPLADTCTGDCPPPPGSRCAPLYAQISQTTEELAQRRAAMLADRSTADGGLGMYDLFLRDPSAKVSDPRDPTKNLGNWSGHRMQILEKQQYLRGLIARYRQQGCSPLPPGAETQANLPPPGSPFSW